MPNDHNSHQTAQETKKQVRRRLTPQEQIDAAKTVLARAQARQRAHDTRSKIVVGAIAQKWLFGNAQAARAFVAHVKSLELREHDVDVISSFIDELGVSVNETHHHGNAQP